MLKRCFSELREFSFLFFRREKGGGKFFLVVKSLYFKYLIKKTMLLLSESAYPVI